MWVRVTLAGSSVSPTILWLNTDAFATIEPTGDGGSFWRPISRHLPTYTCLQSTEDIMMWVTVARG